MSPSLPFPRPPLRRLAAAGAALLIGGCASVGAPVHGPTPGDDPAWRTAPDGVRWWIATDPLARRSYCLAAADIGFGPQVALEAAERQALQAELQASLAERFAAAELAVAEPAACGPGDLQVKTQVVAVERARPLANVITTLLLLAPLSRGGLGVEFEVADAKGRRVAALALHARAGAADLGAAFSELGHAHGQAWVAAERLAQLLAGAARTTPESDHAAR